MALGSTASSSGRHGAPSGVSATPDGAKRKASKGKKSKKRKGFADRLGDLLEDAVDLRPFGAFPIARGARWPHRWCRLVPGSGAESIRLRHDGQRSQLVSVLRPVPPRHLSAPRPPLMVRSWGSACVSVDAIGRPQAWLDGPMQNGEQKCASRS